MDFKPLISWKSLEDLRLEAFQRLAGLKSKITNLNIGGVFRTLLELSLQALADFYNLLLTIAPMGFAKYASGQWLDEKVADVEITRHPAKKTKGQVVFGRNSAQGNVKVPAGTILRTDLSSKGEVLSYFTTAETIIPNGVFELGIPIQAEFEGAKYNVGTGMIKNLATPISGIDYVRNDALWITEEGADKESDESLRTRYQLRWNELAQGGTKLSYVSWAREVLGVFDALAERNPRGPNTVDIVILGSTGTTPQTLVDQVKVYIDEHAPMTADVLVRAVVSVIVNVDVLMKVAPETDPVTAKAEAEKRVRAMFGQEQISGIERLKIGMDPFRAKISSLVMAVPGTVNAIVNQPPTDPVISSSQIAVLGTLTIVAEKVTSL